MIAYLELLDTPQEKTAFQTLYEMYAKKMYLAAVRIVDDSAARYIFFAYISYSV